MIPALLEKLPKKRKDLWKYTEEEIEIYNETIDLCTQALNKCKLGLDVNKMEKIMLDTLLSGKTPIKVDNISIDPIYLKSLASALAEAGESLIIVEEK